MKYLLVFVTIWSFSSEPNGAWDHTEYDWQNNLQECEDYAKLKISHVNEVQSKQFLNKMFYSKPMMNLNDYEYHCWSEKEVEEFQNAERKSLDGDT